MNRRLISAAMAVLVLMSFTSCGFIGRLRPENTTVSVTTEETAKETASETAATTEETTTEQTTSKEATAATEEDGEAWYNDKYCDDYYQYMK